jgi:PhzF family phenazine biosynthesis protein
LLRGGSVDEATVAEAAACLGIGRDEVVDAAWADNGPGWVGVLLRSADAVLALRPGPMRLSIGVAGMYPPGSPFAYEARAFYSEAGITFEDPVTGSLNASLAQWLIATGRATAPYTVSQGTAIGRAGRVRITSDATGAVWVGGDVVTCVTGSVEL